MTGCWAIVPVKDLDSAKSRLAPRLGSGERASLSLEMLGRVLSAAAEAGGLSTLVVSRDRRARDLAFAKGMELLEDRWGDLNQSLEDGSRWCLERGASSILVLHADLPLVTRGDIAAMKEPGRAAPSVVVAPCRKEEGTNALFVQPPGLIPFSFGPGSFDRHVKLAQCQGATLRIYRSPSIALDIDTLDDLDLFRAQMSLAEGRPR